jgi:hypothetical protein
MAKPRSNRREFLRGGAIAAGVAAGGLLDVDGRAAPIPPRPVAKDSWDYGVRS